MERITKAEYMMLRRAGIKRIKRTKRAFWMTEA